MKLLLTDDWLRAPTNPTRRKVWLKEKQTIRVKHLAAPKLLVQVYQPLDGPMRVTGYVTFTYSDGQQNKPDRLAYSPETGTPNLAEAIEWCARVHREKAEAPNKRDEPSDWSKCGTLSDVVSLWLRDQETAGRWMPGSKTPATYRKYFGSLLTTAQRKTDPRQIDETWLSGVLLSIYDDRTGVGRYDFANRMRALLTRALNRWRKKTNREPLALDHVEDDDAVRGGTPSTPADPVLTEAHLPGIVAEAHRRITEGWGKVRKDKWLTDISTGNMLLFTLYTAARMEESLRLTWADIDFDAGIVHWKIWKNGGKRAGKPREFDIPMTTQVRQLLEDQLRLSATLEGDSRQRFVFPGQRAGMALGVDCLRAAMLAATNGLTNSQKQLRKLFDHCGMEAMQPEAVVDHLMTHAPTTVGRKNYKGLNSEAKRDLVLRVAQAINTRQYDIGTGKGGNVVQFQGAGA